MITEQEVLFFFSALGAFNGLLLSAYFLFGAKERGWSSYFLGGLLLVLSIRIAKSVFFHFNPQLSTAFIQLGLSACLLVGPFLLYYLRSMKHAADWQLRTWWWHLMIWLLPITVLGCFFPYVSYRNVWAFFVVRTIYIQWLGYLIWSAYLLRHDFGALWQRKRLPVSSIWQLNIFVGVALIWLAYFTVSFTSYIVGALSFSFVFYISIILWIFGKGTYLLKPEPIKPYANSSLTNEVAMLKMRQVAEAMKTHKYYLDPDLNLSKLSEQLAISSKELSQVINQQTGKNYAKYLASLRVAEAKRLLTDPDYDHWKISAIAYESGFNSISAFNSSFRREVGQTAKQFRESGRKRLPDS